MIKAVVFDLDGTIIDSLEDIHDALNKALTFYKKSVITIEDTKNYLGDGITMLVKRASKIFDDNNPLLQNIKQYYAAYYHEHCLIKTKPYNHVIDLLKELKGKGIKIFVLSNKPHLDTLKIVKHYFNNLFDEVFGCSDEAKKKPSPVMLEYILNEYHLKSSEVLMVGDSPVDIKTAKACEIKSIACTYGFKSYLELAKSSPSYIVNDPKDIAKFVFLIR